MVTFLFLVFTVCSVSFAFFLRDRYSGRNLKLRYALGCLGYNLVFCISYLKLAKYNCIAFYGCFPNLEKEYPAIVWISLICFLLHAAAHPMEWTPKFRRRWGFRKSK